MPKAPVKKVKARGKSVPPMSRDDVRRILEGFLEPRAVPSEQVMASLARASGLTDADVLSLAKVIAADAGENPDEYFIPPGGIMA